MMPAGFGALVGLHLPSRVSPLRLSARFCQGRGLQPMPGLVGRGVHLASGQWPCDSEGFMVVGCCFGHACLNARVHREAQRPSPRTGLGTWVDAQIPCPLTVWHTSNTSICKALLAHIHGVPKTTVEGRGRVHPTEGKLCRWGSQSDH